VRDFTRAARPLVSPALQQDDVTQLRAGVRVQLSKGLSVVADQPQQQLNGFRWHHPELAVILPGRLHQHRDLPAQLKLFLSYLLCQLQEWCDCRHKLGLAGQGQQQALSWCRCCNWWHKCCCCWR
jgi:hypothetical protein